MRWSYLYNGDSYTSKTASLYWGHRADSRFASSQWETSSQSNAVSYWLGANLEWALRYLYIESVPRALPSVLPVHTASHTQSSRKLGSKSQEVGAKATLVVPVFTSSQENHLASWHGPGLPTGPGAYSKTLEMPGHQQSLFWRQWHQDIGRLLSRDSGSRTSTTSPLETVASGHQQPPLQRQWLQDINKLPSLTGQHTEPRTTPLLY